MSSALRSSSPLVRRFWRRFWVELNQPFLALFLLFNPLPLCTPLGFPQAKAKLFLTFHDDYSGDFSDLLIKLGVDVVLTGNRILAVETRTIRRASGVDAGRSGAAVGTPVGERSGGCRLFLYRIQHTCRRWLL